MLVGTQTYVLTTPGSVVLTCAQASNIAVQYRVSNISGTVLLRVEVSVDGTIFSSVTDSDIAVTTNSNAIVSINHIPSSFVRFTFISGTGQVDVVVGMGE